VVIAFDASVTFFVSRLVFSCDHGENILSASDHLSIVKLYQQPYAGIDANRCDDGRHNAYFVLMGLLDTMIEEQINRVWATLTANGTNTTNCQNLFWQEEQNSEEAYGHYQQSLHKSDNKIPSVDH
jgi:hypothetical protein